MREPMKPMALDGSERDKLLEDARERLRFALDVESANRSRGKEDLRFAVGDAQWDAQSVSSRARDGRPCLTVNRVPGFIRHITNEERRSRPSMLVDPINSLGDAETADVLQGRIRQIEYLSNADVAYAVAFDQAVRSGAGYFRFVLEYESAESFRQQIKIKPIANRFSVALDPMRQMPDGSDADWGFVFVDVARRDFERQYPKAQVLNWLDWQAQGSRFDGWVKKDVIRVAEYFFGEMIEDELIELPGGAAAYVSLLSPDVLESLQDARRRPTWRRVMHHTITNGVEVLAATQWPGPWVPIVEVVGERQQIDGEIRMHGLVREIADSQRMLNFMKSAQAEIISLSPKAPFIGAAGQFEGFEDKWSTVNRVSHPYLEFNDRSTIGQPHGAPQRLFGEPPVQAITQAVAMAVDDIKSQSGIFDASLGATSNETSGRAIRARQAQGQLANLHFADNLRISIRHGGRITLAALKEIESEPMEIQIRTLEGAQRLVKVNQDYEDRLSGKKKRHDLWKDGYDVRMDAGPAYATRRQEALDMLTELSRANPKILDIASDLIVANSDAPGARQIAERLKRALPPGLRDPEDRDDDGPALPPAVTEKLAAYEKMVDALTEKVNLLEDKAAISAEDRESRERIETSKLAVQVALKLAEVDPAAATPLLRAALADLEQRLELLEIDRPVASVTKPESGPSGPVADAPMDSRAMTLPTHSLRPEPDALRVGPSNGGLSAGVDLDAGEEMF